MPNRLAASTSPYLLQHADNPVDWQPWSAEAFAEAKRRGVPVFISIGYSACHWCHVMAHESFMDPEVAAYLNEHFVAIKVDREERPDVDAVYMRATAALTGQGGWPMSVFTDPDGRPFFAGTYFPPEQRGGMPSFMQVLTALAEAWDTRHDEVVSSASAIVEQLAQINALPQADQPAVWPLIEQVTSSFDPINGGWGTAPKFPSPLLIDALLVKGDAGTLDLGQRALEHMARGGIHDQLGGGFHRYSVDASWVVPHFEKMLYDNALLLGAYTRAWRRTPSHSVVQRWLFERSVRGIVTWLAADMVTDSGAFAASMDADSQDIAGVLHEGIYYVWNPELLADALGEEDGAWASKIMHVTEQGTFDDGLSTLQLTGIPDGERFESVCERLLAARETRWAPDRDDKVVASWNAWTITSLVWAGEVFGEQDWVELARRAAQALWDTHWVDGRLARTSLDGHVEPAPGIAEDYGAVASAFATLAGALGDPVWLDRAEQILDAALPLFEAPDGGFYDAEASELFDRPREIADNPTPSGTSSLIEALRLVGAMAERRDLIERADAAAATTYGVLTRNPEFAGSSLRDLLAADEGRHGLAPAVAVVVDESDKIVTDASSAAWRMLPVGSIVIRGREGTAFRGWFEGRGVRAPGEFGMPEAANAEYDEHEDVDLAGTVYVCRGETCFPPASTVKELRSALWQRR